MTMPRPKHTRFTDIIEVAQPVYRHISENGYDSTQWRQNPDERLIIHANNCLWWRTHVCRCKIDILHVGPRQAGG
jgi:hypothetical protein